MKAMQYWTRIWDDKPRHRFVIRRRAGRIERDTCVRYGNQLSRTIAMHRAHWIYFRLRRCAIHNLKAFQFTP